MSNIPSIAMIPSAYKSGKVYSVLPSDGSGDLNFARASEATRVNKDGFIEKVGSNVPRIDYTDGGCPKLLLEPLSTNLITHSEDFTDASWVRSDFTVNNISSINPKGVSDTVSNIVGNTGAFTNIFTNTQSSGVEYTISCYVKSNNQSKDDFRLRLGGNYSSIFTATSEWVRYEFTATVGTQVFAISNDGANEVDILIWGAQLEQGSYATSYIPTSGATATREAETLSKTGLSNYINSSEGVLYAEIAVLSADTINRYISLSDGTDDNSISFHFRNNANNQIRVILKSGNVNQFDSIYNPSGSTDFAKVAFKYKLNNFALWVNGVELAVDTNGITFSANTLNEFSFDDGNGNSKFYGKVKALAVYNTVLTDTELQNLTS